MVKDITTLQRHAWSFFYSVSKILEIIDAFHANPWLVVFLAINITIH